MNFLKFEDFFSVVFGGGQTTGEMLFECQDTQVSEETRDIALIQDLYSLHGNEGSLLFRTYTKSEELVLLTRIDSSLQETGFLVKGDKRIPIWLLNATEPLRKVYEASEISDEFDFFLPCPGVDGWEFEPTSGESYDYENLITPKDVLDKTKKISIAVAADFRSVNWKNVELEIPALIDALTDHKEGDKDGSCLLQGEVFEAQGTTRKATGMLRNSILCLDLDNGLSVNELDNQLAKFGYAYVRYTTHSHNARITDVSKKQFAKFSSNQEVTLQGLRDFLILEKNYTKKVAATAESFEFFQKPDADCYRINHGPIAKNRVIFFLNEPFIFRGVNAPSDSVEKWKERYLGFAESLGIPYDRSCTDAARLFYFPRHPKGRTDFEAKFFDGKTVDLFKFEAIRPQHLKAKIKANKYIHRPSDNSSSPLAIVSSFMNKAKSAPEDRDIFKWMKERAFEIGTAIKDCNPDKIIDDKAAQGKGYHIICPNEDMHSKAGGSGTFVVNASESENGQFHIHCTHAHCFDIDKIGLLKLMLERGDYFDENLMIDEEYAPSLLTDDDEVKPVAEAPVKAAAEEVKTSSPDIPPEKSSKKKSANIVNFGIMEEMNKAYATVLMPPRNLFLRVDEDNEDGFVLLNKEAFESDCQKRFKGDKKDESNKPLSMAWMEWEGRRHYKNILFDPSDIVSPDTLTTFRGFKNVIPKSTDWSLFRNHILHNLCDSDELVFNVLMTWMAHIIQRPWEKPKFAVVISGKVGTGKSMFADFLSMLISPYKTKLSNKQHLVGNFNSHIERALLVVAEEAFFAGEIHTDSVIKDLITSDSILLERKGVDARSVKNFSRFIFLSNEDWVIKARADKERRYLCLEANKDESPEYFEKIHHQMKEENGLHGMMYELMNWVPPFEIGFDVLQTAPPATAGLRKQQTQSLDVGERYFLDILNKGYIPNDGQYEFLNLDIPTTVNYHDFQKDFNLNTGRTSGKYKTADWFDKLIVKYLNGKKKRFDMTSGIMVVVPPLNEIREEFQKTSLLELNTEDLVAEKTKLRVVRNDVDRENKSNIA